MIYYYLSILLVTTSVTDPFIDAESWRSSSCSCSRPSTTGTNGARASPGSYADTQWATSLSLCMWRTTSPWIPAGLTVCSRKPASPFMDAAVIVSIIQSISAHGSRESINFSC
ncbi:Diacylglycerol O-acyltransferase 2 [Zea mays]|uniref:Diacylglycerol O-acyltransferase 2 n=1 Tax=Zea mays TaxID=4577 RepID=B4FLI1_MAIZE|nr:unknown [Zea mays]AQL03436.1 Diacylglycerol O-acyltransferase 2 [Zea mays]